MNKKIKNICCICGLPSIVGLGHNPAPFLGHRCCDVCNDLLVIPARMANLTSRQIAQAMHDHIDKEEEA
jgi:hypothetical protein